MWLWSPRFQFVEQIGFENSNLLHKCIKYDKEKPTQENVWVGLAVFNLGGHLDHVIVVKHIKKMSLFVIFPNVCIIHE